MAGGGGGGIPSALYPEDRPSRDRTRDPGQRRAAPALGRGPRTRSHDGYRANADVVSVVFPVAPAARRHATHDACLFLEATAQVSDVCARSEDLMSEFQSLMSISFP